MKRRVLISSAICLMLVGCSVQTVHVVDSSGVPLANAQVEAVSPSINSGPILTDKNGDARLPSNLQDAQWIDVSKAGFEKAQVSNSNQWPLVIVLAGPNIGK